MRDYSIKVPGYHYSSLEGWPAIEQMQWNRSCRQYGEFFAVMMQPNRFDKKQSSGFSLPLGMVWMMQSFPADWDEAANSVPDFDPTLTYTPEELAQMQTAKTAVLSGRYLSEVMINQPLFNVFLAQVFNTSYACPAETCMALALSANPDIAGIGVSSVNEERITLPPRFVFATSHFLVAPY